MSLGKRNRSGDEPVDTGNKRRKIYSISRKPKHARSINPFVSIPIPTPESPSFPLFRLPAELRNQIWDYLYGNQTVHVDLKSFNKPAEASHADLTYTIWRKPTYLHYKTSFRLPPRVCKQFYAEATAALYASSAFSFIEPHSFRAFALSQHACVARIQHLRVPRLTHHWEDALVCSLVGRLKGLRGVKLTHHYWRSIEARPVPCAADAEWKSLWRMIRAFRQHELEGNLTKFEVVVYNMYKNAGRNTGPWAADTILGPGEPQYDNMIELQRNFTGGLLEHTPRRLSRRGATNG